jgi:hypothetical protein
MCAGDLALNRALRLAVRGALAALWESPFCRETCYNSNMETIKRLSDVDPRDLAVVERVFGQRISSMRGAVLILKTLESSPQDPNVDAQDDLPSWCNVLEGMSDEDLAEFKASLWTNRCV